MILCLHIDHRIFCRIYSVLIILSHAAVDSCYNETNYTRGKLTTLSNLVITVRSSPMAVSHQHHGHGSYECSPFPVQNIVLILSDVV